MRQADTAQQIEIAWVVCKARVAIPVNEAKLRVPLLV